MKNQHLSWVLSLCFCLLLSTILYFFIRFATNEVSEKRASLLAEQGNSLRIIQQLIDDADTASRLGKDREVEDFEKYLIVVNSNQTISRIDNLAKISRLSSFSYSFSPEQSWGKDEYNGLYKSVLTLQAEAPHDLYIYRFLKRLQSSLSGLARLNMLDIERSSSVITANNLRFSAEIEWIKNGEIEP